METRPLAGFYYFASLPLSPAQIDNIMALARQQSWTANHLPPYRVDRDYEGDPLCFEWELRP